MKSPTMFMVGADAAVGAALLAGRWDYADSGAPTLMPCRRQ